MTEFNADAAKVFSLQDYSPKGAIDGVQFVDLKRFNDDGGSMTELGRFDGGMHAGLPGFVVRQVNYSTMDPLAIKAFHLHARQTDVWYVPPSDKILLVLADCRAGSKTERQVRRYVLGDGNSKLVRIPPGVAHGAKNLRSKTPSVIVYFVDVLFSTGADCDEGRIPWDHFGAEVWQVERG